MLHTEYRPPKGLPNGNAGALFQKHPMSDRRRVRRSIVLAQSTADAGTATGSSLSRIYTPSSRLRVSFGIAFFPTGGSTEQPTIAATALWTARPTLRDPISGRHATLMQALFTDRSLPDAYEADSAMERIDITATLVHVASTVGHWMLIAEWEPNTPITDEELDHLFASCDLQIQGSPLTLST